MLSAAGVAFGSAVRDSPLPMDASWGSYLHKRLACGNPLIATAKVLVYLGLPPWFYLLVGGTCIYLATRKRWSEVTYLVLSALGGGVIDTIVKRIVDRLRPDIPRPCNYKAFSGERWSFPSGHSMTAVIVYGALLVIILPRLNTRWRVPAIALAVFLPLAIGFSRLSLGVHWVSDILGGWFLGAAWLAVSTFAYVRWGKASS